jgi:hypothetical protein
VDQFISDLLDQIEKEFANHNDRKEVYDGIKYTIDEKIDSQYSHLGTQAKFGAAHQGARVSSPRGISPRKDEDDDL